MGYKSIQDKYSLLGVEGEGAGSYMQSMGTAMARGKKTLEKSTLEKVWWLGSYQKEVTFTSKLKDD